MSKIEKKFWLIGSIYDLIKRPAVDEDIKLNVFIGIAENISMHNVLKPEKWNPFKSV